MSTQPEVSKQQSAGLPSSSTSLNAGTGWGAAAPDAEAKEANAGAGATGEQESQPHYLTSSGLFEKPSVQAAWRDEILDSTPVPIPEPETSGLVNEFRSALLQPQNKEEENPPRKNRKEALALAVVSLLLAATAATIYLYHPKKSVAEFQTAKTWLAKQWTSQLREISTMFHPQTAGLKNTKSDHGRGSHPFMRGRRPAGRGTGVGSASLWKLQSDKNAKPFNLFVTDSYGRQWMLTPGGYEFGPVNRQGKLPTAKAGAYPLAQKDCRSLFYPGCP